jgi:pimeloyl-ACP methyl ester carboxylesterase
MRRLNHIVLIHGASHGAYCWEKLALLLRKMGYRVSAPDLPGLGADQTPIRQVTLHSYIDRTVETVKAAGEPVLLLGHSMGGAVVCGAAEAIFEQIGKLVFLAGLVLQDGDTMEEVTRQYFPAFPAEPAADGALDFDPSTFGAVFYNTCSPETVGRAIAQVRRQAHAPFKTPLHLTAARFGKLSKTYIVCTQDQATPVAAQNNFCMHTPEMKKREINTDHSPFYSDPEGLSAIIDEEARLTS